MHHDGPGRIRSKRLAWQRHTSPTVERSRPCRRGDRGHPGSHLPADVSVWNHRTSRSQHPTRDPRAVDRTLSRRPPRLRSCGGSTQDRRPDMLTRRPRAIHDRRAIAGKQLSVVRLHGAGGLPGCRDHARRADSWVLIGTPRRRPMPMACRWCRRCADALACGGDAASCRQPMRSAAPRLHPGELARQVMTTHPASGE